MSLLYLRTKPAIFLPDETHFGGQDFQRGLTTVILRPVMLEGSVWRKPVSTSKLGILERDQHFFAVVLSKMNVEMRKM